MQPCPLNIDQKLEKAIGLYNKGHFAEAETICRGILETVPNDANALHLTGLIALKKNDPATAVQMISLAISNKPEVSLFHFNLGLAWLAAEKIKRAEECFQNVLQLAPGNASICFKIGNILRQRLRLPESISYYEKTLAIEPQHVAALNNMGNSFRDLGLLEKAITCFNKALEVQPDHPEIYNNCGNAYRMMGDADKACACFQKALELKPDYGDALNNMGYLLHRTGELSSAVAYYKKALKVMPHEAGIYQNIGNALMAQGKFTEAINTYQKALVLRPNFTAAHSNILFCMNYDPEATPAQMYQAARQWWQQQAASLEDHHTFSNSPEEKRRLRVGYISPDFKAHSVSFFFLSLITHHDHDKIESFCYSDTSKEDQMTDRIRTAADHWLRVKGVKDSALAEQIKKDQIDILVDLTGHTTNNRLLVLARKPAPIQITWLGYPNTTGLPVIDYRLTDDIADPAGEADSFYSETLIRLPHGFLCYSPPDDAPAIDKLPARLKGMITFGSFNNLAKVGEIVIAAWAEILKQTPDSKLLIKNYLLADKKIKEGYLALFARYGIADDRINLLQITPSMQEHLELYNTIDIALDSFPYNGTTTTCEALWMGVPVIAMCGKVHAARVSASILTRIGMEELIATDVDDYIARATALANDLDRLEELRNSMRERMSASPLCVPKGFALDIEQTYRTVWQQWCRTR